MHDYDDYTTSIAVSDSWVLIKRSKYTAFLTETALTSLEVDQHALDIKAPEKVQR